MTPPSVLQVCGHFVSQWRKIVLFAALIATATSPRLAAMTLLWPEQDPYFSMTLPDAWTCKPEGNKLKCKAGDKSGMTFHVHLTKWKTEEVMNAQLRAFGDELAKKFENAEPGSIKQTTSSGNIKVSRFTTNAVSDGLKIIPWGAAFRTGDNPFVLLTGAIQQESSEQAKLLLQILDSIAPVSNEDEAKSSAAKFDPYKGSLETLLPAEFSDAGIKFKRTAAKDRTATWKDVGGVEATGFSYNLISIVIVKLEGEVVNFATSTDAVAALKRIAAKEGATVTPKGNGQRFSARNGQIVGWTNGTVMCVVIGGTDPAAGNFEKAAAF